MRHRLQYRVILVAAFVAVGVAEAQSPAGPIVESPEGMKALGYTSVASALAAISAKPGVTVSVSKPDGWTIVAEPDTYALWSFTPSGHYAHPAVVRRTIKTGEDGNVYVEMVALCQAPKEPCDRLIREFEDLNQRMRQSMQNKAKK